MDLLVIRRSAYGDILHLLPALSALKGAIPGLRLSLLVRERFAPLARRAPFVDEVWTALERRPEAVVDCQGLLRTAWEAWRSGAPVRAGLSFRDVREKPAALLYNRRVPVTAVHVVDRHAQLLGGALGAKIEVDPAWRAAFLVSREPEVDRFLERVPAPRVLVHPASSQPGKHLQAGEWRSVLDLLRGEGYSVVLSCGPGEEALLEPWLRAAPGSVVAPVLPLESLGALVAGCRLMLGADTGITHLADQLGLPVLSRFTLWPPERNGPRFSPSLVYWRRPVDEAEAASWLADRGLVHSRP